MDSLMFGSEPEFDITKPISNKVVCKKEFTLFQINIFLSTSRFTKKGDKNYIVPHYPLKKRVNY